MLKSGSCDAVTAELFRLNQPAVTGRAASAAKVPQGGTDSARNGDARVSPGEPNATHRAASGFASVLYTQLFQQMQQTIPKEEDEEEEVGGLGQSAQDFLGMYLPMVLSKQRGDPLTQSVEQYMKVQLGDQTNERD